MDVEPQVPFEEDAMDKEQILNTIPPAGCPGHKEVPTEKEQEALSAMRSIKERVRELKKRLDAMKASDQDENAARISEIQEELAHLKVDWNRWEEKRKKAARERMILLGHEKSIED